MIFPVRFGVLWWIVDTIARSMNDSNTAAASAFLAQHDFVRAIAQRAAPWPDLVDDIVQQVFLEYMKKADRWDLEKDIRPLLATMTRMVAKRHWRTATRNQEDTVRQLAEHLRQLAMEGEDEPGIEASGVKALKRCIRELPERSQNLVELYYFSGLSSRDIGEQTQTNPDTVCRALSRTRDALRRCLKKSQIESIRHA